MIDIYLLLALLCVAASAITMRYADRADARRRAPVVFGTDSPVLPLNVGVPTARRRGLW